MFKINVSKTNNDESKEYEIYYTNEYQELKSIPYDNESEIRSIPYGLTVTDINSNDKVVATCLLKNIFFPIAVSAKRNIVPLKEDEYWALYDAYYENEKEVDKARSEIFRTFYLKSVGETIAAEIATKAHIKCKKYM